MNGESAVSISVYDIDFMFCIKLAETSCELNSGDFRERFGVAETMRFVAMVLYPESVNFILHHGSQPDLSFNQEFPLGVTFLYFLRPDGHTYDLICFSPV